MSSNEALLTAEAVLDAAAESAVTASSGGTGSVLSMSLPWWAIALLGVGLAVFIVLIVLSIARNRGIKRSLFASPYGLWMIIFTVVPMLIIGYYALTDANGAFTLGNLRSFWDSNYSQRQKAEAEYQKRYADYEAEKAAFYAEPEAFVEKFIHAQLTEPENAVAAKRAEIAEAEEQGKTKRVKNLKNQLKALEASLAEAQARYDPDDPALQARVFESIQPPKPYEPIPYGSGNVQTLLWSLWLAFLCTMICLIIAYPAALFMADRKMKRASSLVILFVVPMWMNITLRTYAMTIPMNLMSLMDTPTAVLIGMVYNFLPFMVFPIYTVLSKLDPALLEASADLGANPARSLLRVTIPLSIPGVVSGITMVFMPAVTTFTLNVMLGGTKRNMLGNLIESTFMQEKNWNLGSAMSLVMMVLILISLTILRKADPNNEGGGM